MQPTVKIGLVAPFEGRYRYVGYDVIYAVRLAVREINAAGGVGGYNVELVAYDDGADPVMAVEQARKLIVDPDVVAVIGHFREETTDAVSSVYVEAGLPLVSPAVLAPAFTGEEAEIYRLAPPAELVTRALLQRVNELEQHQTALVTDGGPLGVALHQLGLSNQVQISPVVSPRQADWLEDVIASGVEVVSCDADPVTTGEVIVALRSAGWRGVFLGGPELALPDFVAVAGEAAVDAVFVTPWSLPVDVSADVKFADSYRAVSNGVPPGSLSFPAYEATRVLLEALERDIAAYGKPTRGGIDMMFEAVEWNDVPLYWYSIDVGGIPKARRGD